MLNRRFLSAVLAALLVCGMLCACGRTSENVDTAATETVTEPETQAPVNPRLTLDTPELNFGGRTVNVLSIKYDPYFTMMDVEGMTGEPVLDAIYTRNRKIEADYGIKLNCVGQGWNENLNSIEIQVKAGTSDGAYDLIMLIDRDAFTAALENYLVGYDKLDYVDTDKDYYFTGINEKCTVGGHTFFAYGYDSINVMCLSVCLYFNKQMASEHQFGNLYDTVRDKTWTMDKMEELCAMTAQDLDGDGLRYGSDILGFIGDYDKVVPTAWISAGEFIVSKDEDDLPVYSAKGNDRFLQATQRGVDFFTKDYCLCYTANDGKTVSFMNGKAFIYSSLIGQLYDLKGMSSDYGVLPWPKYDAAQKDYVNRNGGGWLHIVPTTNTDTDMAGALLQALACYSYDTVYDAYYSNALSARYVRDPDSVEVIQSILSTLVVDLGDTVWYSSLRAPMVAEIMNGGKNVGLASIVKRYERTANSQFKSVQNFLKKYEGRE